MLMESVRVFVAAVTLLASSGTTSSPPFELSVRRDRLIGGSPGTLVVGQEGVEFRSVDQGQSRRWAYSALQQVRILSPTRIALETYEAQNWLHFGADRSYKFEATGVVSSELVAFLLGRVDRPVVTAVLPPLPESPLFQASVKAQGGPGSDGTLSLHDDGLAYVTDVETAKRYWRFRDIFAVLMLDRHRLQVLAYEGGSGETRTFTFDLTQAPPPGMYDAIWQRVNSPKRLSSITHTEDTMNHRWTTAGILAVGITAGGAQLTATQEQQQQHLSTVAPQHQMDHMHKMMAEMRANTAKLEELLAKMDAAVGMAKMNAMAEVVTALVRERTAMAAHMTGIQGGQQMPGMMAMHGGSDAMTTMNHGEGMSHSSAEAGAVEIAFKTTPQQPRMGDNAIEITLKTDKGQPVTDATVTVTFYMPAMPQMNMPEMKSTATLKHDTAGVYRGTGQIVMAGRWDVTITAVRAGKEIASKKLVTAAR